MKDRDSHVRALLNLIQDDDVKVASLAMEQFLKLGGGMAERLIAENQEAPDPRLRHRIHQLSSIFQRRRSRLDFIRLLRNQQMRTWEGLCRVNSLYDSQCRLDQLLEAPRGLIREMTRGGPPALPRIAAIMRQHGYAVPEEEVVDIDLYLVESVVESRFGSSVVLATLACHAASEAGWQGAVGLYQGRFCLIDPRHRLLDPSEGWRLSRQATSELIHPCAARDIWLAVLTQLFLIALVEGHLRDIYHFGSLLAMLNGGGLASLPPPLGQGG